ncbi:MAG: hypothetical protein L7W43_15325 [Rubripirellula sp.]|nr:hypothetical protein [Rubripirellula sp.]
MKYCQTQMFLTIYRVHRVAICPNGAKRPDDPITDVTGHSKQNCISGAGIIIHQMGKNTRGRPTTCRALPVGTAEVSARSQCPTSIQNAIK